jgi:predicted ATPase/DNA-binding winged helix-turn-helix (wHTH) protein
MTPSGAQETSIRFLGWEIFPTERELLVKGEAAQIGARAFDVLCALVARQGRVVTRQELLEAAWPGLVVEENNLSVQIATLRKVLGAQAIATVTSVGYRLSASLASPIGTPKRSRRGNLPEALPTLFGRDGDIHALKAFLRDHRNVSVIGAGGIGKTRLAQAVAFNLCDAYDDGVWMVDLAPLADSEHLTAAVARALGITLPGQREAQEEVLEAIRDASMLLLLDNCEHVIHAASAFTCGVIAHARRVSVLATSQELLKVPDEQVYRVSTLSVPASEDLVEVQRSGAVALLLARIRGLEPGFALTAQNAPDLVDICRRLDGLPLAIELAAARVPLLGTAGVRRRLDDRFRLLTGGGRTSSARHQTLRETLAWSHGLLNSVEGVVFRRTGVFAGSFTVEMMQTMIVDMNLDEWDVLEHLGALVDKSLVSAEPGEPPRFRLLESARAYALEKLSEAGELDATRRRHAQAVLLTFETSLEKQWVATSSARLTQYLPDLDNCRVALQWAEQNDAALHIALAGASAWIWAATGQSLEGAGHCERALAQITASTPPALEARLQYGWCGLSHYRPGAEKRAAADRAVAMYRATGDRVGLYAALGRLAITAALSGDCAAGESSVAEMATLVDPAWPALARWDLLNARDYVANMQGRFDEGEALAHEQLALATLTGDKQKSLFAMMALQQCAASRGDLETAVELGRETVERARGERFVDKMHVYVANFATALVMRGDLEEGLTAAREAASHCKRTGTLWLEMDAFALLACKRERMGDAAVIIGRAEAANKWRGAFREPVEQRNSDEVMARLQLSFTPEELRVLFARGAMMTDEDAAAIALAD